MDITIGTSRIEDGRTVGQQVVHSQVIEKALTLMGELGEQDALLATKRWRDGPGKVAGSTALVQALKKTEAHRQIFLGKAMHREAGYCEVAGYCIQACLTEAEAAR